MADNNETVRDVCAEMNDCKATSCSTGGCSECNGFDCRDVRRFAELILAAHEREIAAKDAEIRQMHDCCDAIEDELDAKNAEIEAHKRCYHALEVHCKKLEDEYIRATNAIEKAKGGSHD